LVGLDVVLVEFEEFLRVVALFILLKQVEIFPVAVNLDEVVIRMPYTEKVKAPIMFTTRSLTMALVMRERTTRREAV
jgi:hypothetical protein